MEVAAVHRDMSLPCLCCARQISLSFRQPRHPCAVHLLTEVFHLSSHATCNVWRAMRIPGVAASASRLPRDPCALPLTEADVGADKGQWTAVASSAMAPGATCFPFEKATLWFKSLSRKTSSCSVAPLLPARRVACLWSLSGGRLTLECFSGKRCKGSCNCRRNR